MLRVLKGAFCEATWKMIMESQFHKQGYKRLKSKRGLSDIDKIEKRLDQIRRDYLQVHQPASDPDDNPYYSLYIEEFKKMQHCIQNSPKNDQSYFLIGWMNIATLSDVLVDDLFDNTKRDRLNKEVVLDAITALSKKPVLRAGEATSIEMLRLYKDLPRLLKIDTVLGLEDFMSKMGRSKQKQDYYGTYFRSNLRELVHDWQDPVEVSKFMKIFWIYVNSLNDDAQVIQKVEHLILNNKPALTLEEITRLREIYEQIGRINPEIYKKYIKSRIKGGKYTSIAQIGRQISFLVHSQANDTETLKFLIAKLQKMEDQFGQFDRNLHIMLHYLSIKQPTLQLPLSLVKSQAKGCRQAASGKRSINSFVLSSFRSNNQGGKPYISDCLEASRKMIEGNKATQRQEAIKKKIVLMELSHMTPVCRPMFCSFQLEMCILNEQTRRVSSLEANSQELLSSNRPTRERQIRLQILDHYGVNNTDVAYNTKEIGRVLSSKSNTEM